MNPLHASSSSDAPGPSPSPDQAFGTWHWDAASDTLTFTVAGERDEAASSAPAADWLARVNPPERDRLPHAWRASASTGAPFRECEVDVASGQQLRRFLLRGVGDTRATRAGVTGVWLDVTTRALQQSRVWFRHLADALPMMMWAATPAGVVDFVNEPWLRYTGLTSAADWTRAVHPDDREAVQSRWQAAVAAQERYEARYRLRRADGAFRWHSARAVPIVDPRGQVARWLGAFVDDHELRMLVEANQQLLASEQRARQAAEDAGRMKDEFLATLAHELRTPLNAIGGWTSMLKRGDLSAADSAKAIEVIERNADAQRQMIEELLDVSRIISGHIRLDVQPVPLETVVSHALEALRPVADAKGVRLHTAFQPADRPLRADATRLQQVFANLLGNAVKFTPRGGEVHVRLAPVSSGVEVRVTDTGMGIPTTFLPYVFDRFRQAESPGVRRLGGLGLGLSIARQIVHMHGGRIEAFSEGEGRGAEFVVTLGLDGAFAEPLVAGTSPAASAERAPTPLRGLSILVIEDDPDSREMLSVLLENAGAVPVAAETVAEALRLLGDLEVDVVLSDIGMPDRDGFDLIRSLRTFPNVRVRQAPALAVTAFARDEDRERILAAGFDAHVTKPVEPLHLFRAIGAVMQRRAGQASTGPGTPSSP